MKDKKSQNNMELKKSDKIICINDYIVGTTIGKEYEIYNIDEFKYSFIDDGDVIRYNSINEFNKCFKLKEEKEELKPHSFCETTEEKCTLSYCDENGCMNRKRVLVEPKLNVAYKETEGKLFYELDFEFITQMAERMASNKKEGKYGLFNWMKPMSRTDLINLIQAQYRHAMDLMNFKFEDDGRPYGTLEAFSNNAMMINYQLKTYFKDYKFSKKDLLEIQVSPSTKENDNTLFNLYSKFPTVNPPRINEIDEIAKSYSLKINTTDSTGLLTEEK